MARHARGAQGRPTRNVTIEDLGRMVVADYRSNGRKTAARVDEAYRLHLVPFFGGMPLREVGVRSRLYIAHRFAEGAAAATIRLELMHLSRGLTIAFQDGLIRSRPPLATPRVQNVRRMSIPEEKINALLAYLPSDVRDFTEMLYLTGWRWSEVAKLEWSNVNIVDFVIRLEPGTTKNGRGRVFPYENYPPLRGLLNKRKRKTLEAEADLGAKIPLVFHRSGKPIRRITRSWVRACRLAGLEGVVVHDLRRSAAQNMVRSGVPIQTAMQLAGWKTRSIFDRYALVTEEDLLEGTGKLARRWASSKSRLGP